MKCGYVYIWSYRVREEYREEFLEAYGPDGHWVGLFRGTPGYIGTELLCDREDPLRFVTIDRWESYDVWQAFRSEKASEFEKLDRKCESFTLEETQLGMFEPF